METYLENSGSSADYSQLQEDLLAYLQHPVPLNSASIDELLSFPLLTQAQALAIVEHRNHFGWILAIAELQVAGFGGDILQIIQPFVTTEIPISAQWKQLGKALKSGNWNTNFTSKNNSNANSHPQYAGNNLSLKTRLQYQKAGLYDLGLNTEKDAGESMKRGPDFVSFHAAISGVGKVKQLVAGDYLMHFGQGLVFGSGIGMGKSALVLNVKRNGSAIKPYRGLNEYLFLRGFAVMFQIKKWQLTTAISQNKLDGTGLDSSAGFAFSSADLDGLHRTASEIAKRHSVTRNMAGTWLLHVTPKSQVGFGAVDYWYDHSIKAPVYWYQQFNPYGKHLGFLHAFQSQQIGNTHLFSELAWCPQNNSTAFCAGWLAAPAKYTEISIHYRNYQPGFLSPFSTAFGNSTQNEAGFYLGIVVHFSKKCWLSQYADLYRKPWLSYQLFSPARGTDLLWQLDYQPNKKTAFLVRVRQQIQTNSSTENKVRTSTISQVRNIRLQWSSTISRHTEIQFRGESSVAPNSPALVAASLAFAGLNLKFRRSNLDIRYSMFDIANYQLRIYAFEGQLAQEFGSVGYYGKGYSLYLLFSQKISRHLKLGMRASLQQSITADSKTVSSKNGFYLQCLWIH